MDLQTTIATRLGHQPFSATVGDLPDGIAARAALKTFATKAGASWKEVKFLPMTTLRRIYCDRDALADLLKITRDDAGAKGTEIANAPYTPRREEDQTPRNMPGPLGIAARTASTTPPAPTSTPQAAPIVPPAAPAPIGEASNPLSQLHAAIAAIAATNAPQLDEARVIALIEEHATKPRGITLTVSNADTGAARDLGRVHRQQALLIQACSARKADGHRLNVYLAGPAGSGKTTAAKKTAEALGLPFYFNGAIDTEYKLMGFVDAQGRVIRPSFRQAYEHGGVYLFDELDASLPSATMAFNAATANGCCDFPDGTIERHADCVIIAAGNTYMGGATADYVGRNKQDAAFADRFTFLTWDYDEDLETALSTNDQWTARVQDARARAAAKGLKVIISPRATIDGAALLQAGLEWSTVEAMTIKKAMTADQWRALWQ